MGRSSGRSRDEPVHRRRLGFQVCGASSALSSSWLVHPSLRRRDVQPRRYDRERIRRQLGRRGVGIGARLAFFVYARGMPARAHVEAENQHHLHGGPNQVAGLIGDHPGRTCSRTHSVARSSLGHGWRRPAPTAVSPTNMMRRRPVGTAKDDRNNLMFSRHGSAHRGSTVRVRILLRPKTVAAGSPSKICCTCLGGSQARWIRLLT
ncbi:hypothetical protein ABIF21_004136 [Bradyrhizobium elkanii]